MVFPNKLEKNQPMTKKQAKLPRVQRGQTIKYKITTLVQFTFIPNFSHKTSFFFQLLKLYDATRPDLMHG